MRGALGRREFRGAGAGSAVSAGGARARSRRQLARAGARSAGRACVRRRVHCVLAHGGARCARGRRGQALRRRVRVHACT